MFHKFFIQIRERAKTATTTISSILFIRKQQKTEECDKNINDL